MTSDALLRILMVLARILRVVLLVVDAEIERERAAAPVLTDDVDRLLGPADVGVTRTEWRAAIKRSELCAIEVGRRYLARRSDVERWLSSRAVVPAPPKSAPEVETDDPLDLALARAAQRQRRTG